MLLHLEYLLRYPLLDPGLSCVYLETLSLKKPHSAPPLPEPEPEVEVVLV
jgi:hypothetical protein